MMFSSMKRTTYLVASFAFWGVVGAVQAGPVNVIVDDFSDTTGSTFPLVRTVEDGPGTLVGTLESGLSGVLGGRRFTSIGAEVLEVPGLDSLTVDLFNTGGQSVLDFSSTSGVQGRMQLIYGFTLNADLSSLSSVEIALTNFDAPLTGTMMVEATLSSGTTDRVLPVAAVVTPGAQTVSFDITSLTPSFLSDVDTFTFDFRAPKGADFRVDGITVVPEPMTLMFLAVGASWIAVRRGKRN